MKKEQVLGILRHVLTGVGVLAVSKGYADETTVMEIGGGIVALLGTLWSVFSPDKKKGNGY
jgi:hypothetical protein